MRWLIGLVTRVLEEVLFEVTGLATEDMERGGVAPMWPVGVCDVNLPAGPGILPEEFGRVFVAAHEELHTADLAREGRAASGIGASVGVVVEEGRGGELDESGLWHDLQLQSTVQRTRRCFRDVSWGGECGLGGD